MDEVVRPEGWHNWGKAEKKRRQRAMRSSAHRPARNTKRVKLGEAAGLSPRRSSFPWRMFCAETMAGIHGGEVLKWNSNWFSGFNFMKTS